ncbi:MAG: hypothetical protein ACKO1M_01905 [Planctomycetota bacterium]
MPPFARVRRWRSAVCAAAVAWLFAADGFAIEMFTYFGDGSRIGLPSLEVPIEAYPGIPLRSDRLRAKRRAMRMGPGAAVQVGPPGYARGITIRAMPTAQPATAVPVRPAMPAVVTETADAEPQPRADDLIDPPVAPEPEAEAPPAPVSSPSGS